MGEAGPAWRAPAGALSCQQLCGSIIPNLRLRPGLLVEAAINLRRTWLACTEERATQAAEGTRDRSLS